LDTDTADRIINYAGIRRAVGETMQKAWTTIPMVTNHVSADAGALIDYHALLNVDVADKADRVTIGELMLKLTATALAAMPVMNSSLTDEGIIRHGRIHLGMATALDEGLIVPVIHDADRKGLLTISREAKSLALRAKTGALSPDEISGATFTVSNLGAYGSVDFFTPIINPPQAAILGIGRVTNSVVAVDGEIKIRPTVSLSLTYDHRIIDGATAAEFTKILMKLMTTPARTTPATI
jgi:pyruvate dehydrogenase E2 component (dihydrolipoamide acetyltransferase)